MSYDTPCIKPARSRVGGDERRIIELRFGPVGAGQVCKGPGARSDMTAGLGPRRPLVGPHTLWPAPHRDGNPRGSGHGDGDDDDCDDDDIARLGAAVAVAAVAAAACRRTPSTGWLGAGWVARVCDDAWCEGQERAMVPSLTPMKST